MNFEHVSCQVDSLIHPCNWDHYYDVKLLPNELEVVHANGGAHDDSAINDGRKHEDAAKVLKGLMGLKVLER